MERKRQLSENLQSVLCNRRDSHKHCTRVTALSSRAARMKEFQTSFRILEFTSKVV